MTYNCVSSLLPCHTTDFLELRANCELALSSKFQDTRQRGHDKVDIVLALFNKHEPHC